MTTNAFIFIDNVWQELKLYNNVETDERLDEQLDSASMQVISKNSRSFPDFSMIKIIRKDLDGNEEKAYFYGFDKVEKRMWNYYIHSLELIEPTRRLMGVLIDGKAVVQPLDGSKKNLWDTAGTLLLEGTARTINETASFRLAMLGHEKYSKNTFYLMLNTPSPEFYWQAQTSLWECLCDIGNVINCIPRLTANEEETAFDTVYFERVNDITDEYEI